VTNKDKKQEILTMARGMVQARGYNALSFRDLAAAVGIKSASVHYYFPTKGDLAATLAHEYTDEFLAYLNGLVEEGVPWDQCIHAFAGVFRKTLLRENRMCLGGILAAERPDLDLEVQAEVERFTELLVQWLCGVLAKGKPKMKPKELRRQALAIFAAIEGAQLMARGSGDVAVFDDALEAYSDIGLLPPN